MRALLHEVALMVLSGNYDKDQFPSPASAFTREEAWRFLCDLTMQDFGLNWQAWEEWFVDNCNDREIRQMFYEDYFEREREKLKRGGPS